MWVCPTYQTMDHGIPTAVSMHSTARTHYMEREREREREPVAHARSALEGAASHDPVLTPCCSKIHMALAIGASYLTKNSSEFLGGPKL